MIKIQTVAIWVILLLSSLSFSCENADPLAESLEDIPEMGMYKGISQVNLDPVCPKRVALVPSISILDPLYYPDYDLAILIQLPNPPLPMSCMCSKSTFCLDLNFNQADVFPPSITNHFQHGSLGQIFSYLNTGSTPLPFMFGGSQALGGLYPMGSTSQTYTVCADASLGDVVLFKFQNGIPAGLDLQTVVAKVGGLCIVDNIPDPDGQSFP